MDDRAALRRRDRRWVDRASSVGRCVVATTLLLAMIPSVGATSPYKGTGDPSTDGSTPPEVGDTTDPTQLRLDTERPIDLASSPPFLVPPAPGSHQQSSHLGRRLHPVPTTTPGRSPAETADNYSSTTTTVAGNDTALTDTAPTTTTASSDAAPITAPSTMAGNNTAPTDTAPTTTAGSQQGGAHVHDPGTVNEDGRHQLQVSPVDPFLMIGISSSAIEHGEPWIRVRHEHGWSEWMPLEFSPAHAPDDASVEAEGSHPASEPIWVGWADGYALSLPPGTDVDQVDVHLVRDSGIPASDTVEPRYPVDPEVAQRSSAAPGQPTIRSRASWGARPPRKQPLQANVLRLAVVHHSASSNSYTMAQVPSIIRSIQTYHMDANGWNDIAYNFVVDRFGRLWEGRAGGMLNAVIGGHARGFNTGSTSVVALGEYGSAPATTAQRTAVAQLLGWKLFIHGVDPRTTTRFTSLGNETFPAGHQVTLPRIVGHRDTSATACPGNNLQNALPAIRSAATSRYISLRGSSSFTSLVQHLPHGQQALIGDFDGDGNDDVLLYGPGAAPDAIAWGTDTGLAPPTPITISGTYIPMVGDFDGDGRDDIFWYGPGPARDALWYGNANRTFTPRPVNVSGVYRPLVGDFDGDGRDDIFWYGPGAAPDRIWWGRAQRGFTMDATTVSGTYEPILGDFDGDGRTDILWYGPGPARDALWWGTSDRKFSKRGEQVNGTYVPIVGDFTGNHSDDILWYGPGPAPDTLWHGRGDRTFRKALPVQVNGRYQPLVGDFNGGGYDDILWYGPGAAPDRLWISLGNGTYRNHVVNVNGHYVPHVLSIGRNGRDDLLWHRPEAAGDRLWRSNP